MEQKQKSFKFQTKIRRFKENPGIDGEFSSPQPSLFIIFDGFYGFSLIKNNNDVYYLKSWCWEISPPWQIMHCGHFENPQISKCL